MVKKENLYFEDWGIVEQEVIIDLCVSIIENKLKLEQEQEEQSDE